MGKRGNQGWSTRPKDGSPAGNRGWSTLGAIGAGRPKGDLPPRRTHSYRANDEEHELIKRFVKITRTDIQAAAMILAQYETFSRENGIIEPSKKKGASRHGTNESDAITR